MKIDPELQLSILKNLEDFFPHACPSSKLDKTNPHFSANVNYLFQRGLIAEKEYREENLIQPFAIAITAAGIDFLRKNSGMSDDRDFVTVKLHDETMQELIAAIQSSSLPPEKKNGLIAQLRELRGESIKHLTTKLLDAGLDSLPAALPLIQKALGGLL